MAEEHVMTEVEKVRGPITNKIVQAGSLELGGDGDDRSSSLSDIEDRVMADVAENNPEEQSGISEDDDTEAETERLEDSPQKDRKQRVINLKPMQADASKDQSVIEKKEIVEEG